jgi:hypothetical protein
MTSYEYYLKETRIAVGLTLAEPDVTKAARLSLLALQYFDKAEKAKARRSPVSTFTPPASRPAAPRAVLVSTGCTRSKAISTG